MRLILSNYLFLSKYAIGEGGFNLHGGPQFNFILDETLDDISPISFGLTGGLGYDITENFFAEAHYHFQITNSFIGDFDGLTARTDFLNIGVGYKF